MVNGRISNVGILNSGKMKNRRFEGRKREWKRTGERETIEMKV
jgi:hypothetical protein